MQMREGMEDKFMKDLDFTFDIDVALNPTK